MIPTRSTVEITEVHAGFRTIVIRHSCGASAVVQTLGGTVTSWQHQELGEQVFVRQPFAARTR